MPDILKLGAPRRRRRRMKRNTPIGNTSDDTGVSAWTDLPPYPDSESMPVSKSLSESKRLTTKTPKSFLKRQQSRSEKRKFNEYCNVIDKDQCDEMDFAPSSISSRAANPPMSRISRPGFKRKSTKPNSKSNKRPKSLKKGNTGIELKQLEHDSGIGLGSLCLSSNASTVYQSTPTAQQNTLTPMTDNDDVSDAVMSHRTPWARHAVAVDTRYIDTEEGRTNFQEFQSGVVEFLNSISFRSGLMPIGVACLSSNNEKDTTTDNQTTKSRRLSSDHGIMQKRKNVSNESPHVAVEYYESRHGDEQDQFPFTERVPTRADAQRLVYRFLEGAARVPVFPAIYHKNLNIELEATHIPKELTAGKTWKYFGDLGKPPSLWYRIGPTIRSV